PNNDGYNSGVASVELFVKAPGASSYSSAGTDSSPATPSFSFTATVDGSGRAHARAPDTAYNRKASPPPAHPPPSVDTQDPTSTASSAAYSTSHSFPTRRSSDLPNNDGYNSGVASVELFVKAPGASSYSSAGTDSSPATPSFSFTATVD